MATMETTTQKDTNILKSGLKKTIGVLNEAVLQNGREVEAVQAGNSDTMEDTETTTIGRILSIMVILMETMRRMKWFQILQMEKTHTIKDKV